MTPSQDQDLLLPLLKEVQRVHEWLDSIDENIGLSRKNAAKPSYVDLDSGDILIGKPETSVRLMTKTQYHNVFDWVDNPKDFVLRLVSKLISEEELAHFNYHGGEVSCKNGTVTKKVLKHHPIFIAIITHAEIV